jgi:Ca2+-transporting ATPase
MFNAKAFLTGKSTFANITKSTGFLAIAAVILVGQWLIVTVGGKMFNVTPLKYEDWGIIIGITSIVLWVGELNKLLNISKQKINKYEQA